MEKAAIDRADVMMPDEEKAKTVRLTYVIGLAAQEKWGEIDALLPVAAQQLDFFNWAGANLKCLDLNYRDLAASILQYTDLDTNDTKLLSKELITELFRAMDDKAASEANPYPSFRAACALAKRYPDPNNKTMPEDVTNALKGLVEEIELKLQGFVDDEDISVSETAKYYSALLLARTEARAET
jgi:hypothetical protein